MKERPKEARTYLGGERGGCAWSEGGPGLASGFVQEDPGAHGRLGGFVVVVAVKTQGVLGCGTVTLVMDYEVIVGGFIADDSHPARWENMYCLLELNMLCDCVTRGCGDHSPSRPPHDRRDLGMAKEKCLGCRCCAPRAATTSWVCLLRSTIKLLSSSSHTFACF